MILWIFRPDIELPNIKAKLPENHINILLSGRNALSINGSPAAGYGWRDLMIYKMDDRTSGSAQRRYSSPVNGVEPAKSTGVG